MDCSPNVHLHIDCHEEEALFGGVLSLRPLVSGQYLVVTSYSQSSHVRRCSRKMVSHQGCEIFVLKIFLSATAVDKQQVVSTYCAICAFLIHFE